MGGGIATLNVWWHSLIESEAGNGWWPLFLPVPALDSYSIQPGQYIKVSLIRLGYPRPSRPTGEALGIGRIN